MEKKKTIMPFLSPNRRQFLQLAASICTSKGHALSKQIETGVTVASPKKRIYLTDMGQAHPKSALSRCPRRKHWRLLEYETDELNGVMLVAGHNTAAPEVRLPLNQQGWYSIYIGLHSDYGGSRVLVRLKSDKVFSMVIQHDLLGRLERRPEIELAFSSRFSSREHIEELFWKSAELTGEEIVLRQFSVQLHPDDPHSLGNPCHGAQVAYIKLVPLTEEEVKALKEDSTTRRHRRLFAHYDAWGLSAWHRPTTEDELRRELEPYRDTDFSRIYWEAASGDWTMYPSGVGVWATLDWLEDPISVECRLFKESQQAFRSKGINPLKVGLEYAREIGLEFHAAYRPAGFNWPFTDDQCHSLLCHPTEAGLYKTHPEWRGVNRLGRSTPRLSYAYEGVRQFVISLLREIASYPIDGICILYNRRPPLIEYERPIIEGFKAKYGKDPRDLDDRDPLWLSYRAGFLTRFMGELREAMNQVSREQKRAKALEISAVVLATERENLYFGLDLETWVREGLVDCIVPYTSAEGLIAGPARKWPFLRNRNEADSWVNPEDAEFFLRITKGSPCKVALNLMPREISPEDYRSRASRLYQADMDYLFFWDTHQRTDFGPSWQALRRLGHREELAAWVEANSPRMERGSQTLRRLGDWDLSYATPG